jgi:type VI secretion system protein ImpA
MLLVDDLLTPIPGDNPAGVSLRYDPLYDAVKEARREDPDLPQGEWERPRKTADWPRVIQLTGEAIASRSKDLQLAAWLTEAKLQREGVAGLRHGLALLHGLLDGFWEHLYPEIEDGDAGLRTAPLGWIGAQLEMPLKFVPFDTAGHSYFQYRESRLIPAETEASGNREKQKQREVAAAEGKLLPEEFDNAFASTAEEWYAELLYDLDASLELVEALDRLGDEKFGEDAPNYRPLRQLLQEMRQAAVHLLNRKRGMEPDEPAAAASEAPAAASGSVTSVPAPQADPEPVGPPAVAASAAPAEAGAVAEPVLAGISIAPLPHSRDDAVARVAAAARFLRAEDPTDPAPYLLLRGFRWGELRARDTAVDPRLLAAPPTETRTRLKTLLLDEKWAELLDAAEEVMASPYGRGWLDLQRYVLTACERLGSDYAPVADALESALRSLLQDLPELADATLMDDTPTANPDTRHWLHGLGLLDAVAAAGSGTALPRRHGGRDALERALDRVRAGEPAKAIELLMSEASQETSERARFLRRSQAAGIMVDAGMEAVATPLLEEMLQLIEKHKLEEWEADGTVAEPLGLLYRCVRKRNGNSSEAENLYIRVCRLDPLQAIRLAPEADDGE